MKPTKPTTTARKGHSLSELARKLGISPQAVAAGARRGKVTTVTIAGQPRVLDLAGAVREWRANTRTRAPYDGALRLAQARRASALAQLAEGTLRRMQAELVPLADVRAEVADRFERVRSRISRIPADLHARAPHLTADELAMVNALLCECLEELAPPQALAPRPAALLKSLLLDDNAIAPLTTRDTTKGHPR